MAFRNTLGAARTAVALASATSAQDADRNGAALPTNTVEAGSLAVHLAVTISTGSVVATLRHQVADDTTNWYDLRGQNNPASVTITATKTVKIDVPQSFIRYRFYRCVATLSGASTGSSDLTLANYEFLQFGEME